VCIPKQEMIVKKTNCYKSQECAQKHRRKKTRKSISIKGKQIRSILQGITDHKARDHKEELNAYITKTKNMPEKISIWIQACPCICKVIKQNTQNRDKPEAI